MDYSGFYDIVNWKYFISMYSARVFHVEAILLILIKNWTSLTTWCITIDSRHVYCYIFCTICDTVIYKNMHKASTSW